jgi:RNA polymerase sigma-70 factor (ECF subfamily)
MEMPVNLADTEKLANSPEATPPGQADFDALYRAHVHFVWRSLRRLGVREASLEDATQEVFIVVHRRFQDFRPGPTEKAWLFAIALRVASDHRRSVRRKGNLAPLREELIEGTSSPLEGAMKREASDLVLAFLEQLDEARRSAFILCELEQMTGAEASAALGISPNTFFSRVYSARKAFAAYLQERGISAQESSP